MEMEKLAEVEKAVNLSLELTKVSAGDAEGQKLKAQVNQYLKEFESAPDSWKFGLELFLNTKSDYSRFYGISRVIAALEREELYACMSIENRAFVKDSLLRWVGDRTNALGNEKPFLVNKVAVSISLLIKREYPQHWSDAFQQLLIIGNSNRDGASLFLKVLEYVTEEIVALPSQRGAEELAQTTAVKDTMRNSALGDIILFWNQILVQRPDSSLVRQCMNVMREYICWIDINLIVNDQFIPILYRFLSENKEYRVHALKCLREIVRKGMDHESRIHLLRNLNLSTILQKECEKENAATSGNNNVSASNPFRGIEEEDDDDQEDEDEGWGFLENVASTISDIGLQLIDARVGLPKSSPVHPFLLEELSQRILPLALYQCLGSSDQDAQEQIIPFFSKMLSVLGEQVEVEMGQRINTQATRRTIKRTTPISDPDPELEAIFRAVLSQLLPILVRHMCYPANFTFDGYDDDELEFERHRSELRSLYVNIVRVSAIDSVLPFLQELAGYALNPESVFSIPPFQLEITLTLIHAFHEGAPSGIITPGPRTMLEMARLGNSLVQKKSKDRSGNVTPPSTEPLPNDLAKAAAEDERRKVARGVFSELVARVHRCGLGKHQHQRVVLVYNMFVARYPTILSSYCSELIGPVLEGMAGVGGIGHPHATVRSRSCYLLLKVVTGLHQAIIPFAGDLFNHLKDFLDISEDAVVAQVLQSTEEGEQEQQFTPAPKPKYSIEDVMYLYEVASFLIGLDKDTVDPAIVKQKVEVVLFPVHRKLEEIIANVPPLGQSPEQAKRRVLLGTWAADCLLAFSELTKGLSSSQRTAAAVADIFKTCLETGLRSLQVMPEQKLLSSRIHTLLHSLVRIEADAIMAFAPDIGVKLLEQRTELESVLESMQFINQLLTNLKAKVRDSLDGLFRRIISHVVQTLTSHPNPFLASEISSPTSPVTANSQTSALGGARTELQLQYQAVKRVLMQFLFNIVDNDLDSILYSPTNSPYLETVLQVIIDTMVNFPDPHSQKLAVKVLIRMSSIWLVPEKSPGLPPNIRTAFVELLSNEISPATFRLTASPRFSIDELECATLLQKICELHQVQAIHIGQQWRDKMIQTTLPSISCPANLAVEYINKVTDLSASPKDLAVHFKNLFLS